jgi:epoxide hydrolase-like predicted phosphatase
VIEAGTRRGLIVDWGGVLTTDVFSSFEAFCRVEGLPLDHVARAFRHDADARTLLEDLECGRLPEEEFEARLARVLGLGSCDGLIRRVFGGVRPDAAMQDAVAAFHGSGIRTCLLSNSWGSALYEREQFGEMFDAVVISGEVGVRKPQPAIYRLATDAIGLRPEALVFVDDLGGNLKPARAMGMATVLHVEAGTTIPQLQRLLGPHPQSSLRQVVS